MPRFDDQTIARHKRERREGAEFLPRLARAEAEDRVIDPRLVNTMLRRGVVRHTPCRLSLSEMDGDRN